MEWDGKGHRCIEMPLALAATARGQAFSFVWYGVVNACWDGNGLEKRHYIAAQRQNRDLNLRL